jgi:hypothetical protein
MVVKSAGKGKSLLRLTFLAAIAAVTVSACTTVEGTNALVDPMTFEREVMRTTLQGVGLVIPGSGATPPPPSQSAAVIPADSSQVTINTAGLTTADLDALRGGRVISSGATSGRPLTEAEARQLAARMQAYRNAQGGGQRSIYLPPESYFQTVGGQQMICQAANGALVAPSDPSCPADVRAALAAQR